MKAGDPISVRLIPAAEEALKALMKRTGYNRTDAINRAIQVYDAINQMPVGATLKITEEDTNEIPHIAHRAV